MSVLPTDIVAYGSFAMPGYDGSTTLNGAIASTSVATMTVTANASFPQSGEFAVIVDNEIMWVTQGAGTNSWTMIRGMGGTTAATHLTAAAVTSVSGGPVDFLTRVAFTDVVAGDTVDIVSSSASDNLTKNIISVAGRDVAGNFQANKTGVLNGTTAVTGVGSGQVFNRLLFVGIGAGTTVTNNPLTAGGTSMTVTSATGFPASGNYNVQVGKEIMTVTAGQATTTWTVTRGVAPGAPATAHQSGDNIYLLPLGDVAVYDHTPAISAHTMQTGAAQSTGTTPALAKLQAGDGASVSVGQIILITGAPGAGQIRYVTASGALYGTDFVAVNKDWGTLPTNASTYNILNGWVLEVSAGAGVGATVANQVTGIQRSLWGAAADVVGGSQHIYYEKIFPVSNNTVTDLTGATVQISSDSPALPGTSALDIALTNVLNDTGSTVNRQTVPGSGIGAFVVQPAAVSVIAAPGALPHGAAPNAAGAQGVWLRATIPAGTTAYKGSANLRVLGNTI